MYTVLLLAVVDVMSRTERGERTPAKPRLATVRVLTVAITFRLDTSTCRVGEICDVHCVRGRVHFNASLSSALGVPLSPVAHG